MTDSTFNAAQAVPVVAECEYCHKRHDTRIACPAYAAYCASQPSPAATVTDGSIHEGDVLSYTMTDGVGKVTAHVRPHSGSSADSVRTFAEDYASHKEGCEEETWHGKGPIRCSCGYYEALDRLSVSPQAVPVSFADTVEDIAKWLHDETGHPDSYPDHTWPETERDDGRRESGWVKIVPQHAQAYFRDIARRMVARFPPQ